MKKILSAILSALILVGGAVSSYSADASSGLVLAGSSHLVLDRENGYIDMIDGTVTVNELKAEFASEISVAGKGGSAYVATDDIVGVGSDSLKALIWGDCDRNGRVNLKDASDILKYIAGWDTGINTCAADVDRSGGVNLSDISKLMKKLADLPQEIEAAALIYEPSKLTRYCVDLASVFHAFYNACHVRQENKALMAARLKLVDSCRIVLANVLSMLSISAPERM